VQDNNKTIQAYEDHIQEYDSGTPTSVDGAFKAWLDKILALLPAGAHILELGSGMGRDAAYMEAKGFDVLVSDAPKVFVEHLKKHFKKAQQLNALTDELGGPYHLVFANAVFLHFTVHEFSNILDKISGSLQPSGILAFSDKVSERSGWSTAKVGAPRFFQYWQAGPLTKLLTQKGFYVLDMKGIESMRDGQPKWLHVISRKA